jgi:hypothetical protein
VLSEDLSRNYISDGVHVGGDDWSAVPGVCRVLEGVRLVNIDLLAGSNI